MTKLHVSDSFVRLRVGQKSLAPIRACLVKMERMSFLDDSIPHAVRLGREVLAMMPQEGYIERQPFEVLSRCVEIMTDPDKFLNAAHRVRNGVQALDALFPPATPACPAAPRAVSRPVSPRPAFPPSLPGLPGKPSGASRVRFVSPSTRFAVSRRRVVVVPPRTPFFSGTTPVSC
jgi:hypothetical protein